MKVFRCNVCGVDYYEGHETCPFCREPISNSTYVGEKKGNDILCNPEDTVLDNDMECKTDAEDENSDGHKIDISDVDGGTINPVKLMASMMKVGIDAIRDSYTEETSQDSCTKETPPKTVYVEKSYTPQRASTSTIVFVLGIMSIWFGFPLAVATWIVLKVSSKDTWTDENRRLANIGKWIAIASVSIRFIFLVIGFAMFFIQGAGEFFELMLEFN